MLKPHLKSGAFKCFDVLVARSDFDLIDWLESVGLGGGGHKLGPEENRGVEVKYFSSFFLAVGSWSAFPSGLTVGSAEFDVIGHD